MTYPDPARMLSGAERRDGFLAGAVVGAGLAAATWESATPADVQRALVHGALVPLASPVGRRRASTALADGLLAELALGGVDLQRLARRWLDWWAGDAFEADERLAAVLEHLRQFDAPATDMPGSDSVALAAALPAALASASPKSMTAGAFHVARLLAPAETTALCAVAIVLAASTFLEGRRDFTADVVAALRANRAPDLLLDAMRAIPRDPRRAPELPRGASPDPLNVTAWLLWTVHHRPRSTDILRDMALAGGISPAVGALAGALLGARDGIGVWPGNWIEASGDELRIRRQLAAGLGG